MCLNDKVTLLFLCNANWDLYPKYVDVMVLWPYLFPLRYYGILWHEKLLLVLLVCWGGFGTFIVLDSGKIFQVIRQHSLPCTFFLFLFFCILGCSANCFIHHLITISIHFIVHHPTAIKTVDRYCLLKETIKGNKCVLTTSAPLLFNGLK